MFEIKQNYKPKIYLNIHNSYKFKHQRPNSENYNYEFYQYCYTSIN